MSFSIKAGIRKCARIRTLSRVEHRVEYLGDLPRDEPVEPGLEHVLVDLHDVRGSWFRLLVSNRGF